MESNHYYSNNNMNNNSGYNTDLAAMVDGANLHFSNLDLFSGTNMGEVPDNILEDLLHHTHAGTDTNTCNLSEDCSHTQNYLVRVQSEMSPSPNNEEKSSDNDNSVQIGEQKGKKRGRRERGDNKEAVRKYREKLKTRETSLEDEINKLKASNQHLLKRLEGEGALQAEILWLKCLLVDIKGRLEGETSSFRYRRPSETTHTSLYGNDRLINCNGNCGVGGKEGQPGSILYGQGTNGGGSIKFN